MVWLVYWLLVNDPEFKWKLLSSAFAVLQANELYFLLVSLSLRKCICQYVYIQLQGKIACANVLSDLYAMGVSQCDNMLMLLGISENFTHAQRGIVTPMMIHGFTGMCM